MGIDVNWFNESRNAVLWTFQPGWTVIDYHNAADATTDLVDQHGSYYVIADVRHIELAPTTILAAMRNRHSQIRSEYTATIVVGAGSGLRALLGAAQGMRPLRGKFIFVETMGEAVALLEDRFGASAGDY